MIAIFKNDTIVYPIFEKDTIVYGNFFRRGISKR